jgi:hypothetical protein
MEKLVAFYRRVKPEGPGWTRVRQVAGYAGKHAEGTLALQFFNWFLGCALIYGTLFGIGKLIFKEWLPALIYLAVAIVAGVWIYRNLSRVTWTSEEEVDLKPVNEPA